MTSSPQTQPRLSVVVGTLDRKDQLVRLVESVLAQTTTPFRLYITDAGSTDGTVEYLQNQSDPRIVPVLAGQRLGQAKAYNDVFLQCTTEYTCWLSDDNEVVDGGLDKAVQILDGDASIGMVGLKVKDVIGPFAEAPYIGGLSVTGALNVNQGMLRTSLLQRLGGFDEDFRDYGIDPDLTMRVLLSKQDIVFTRQVALQHYRNWETDTTSEAFARMQDRQRAYLLKYAKKYQEMIPPSRVWLARRAVWKTLRHLLRVNPNGPSGQFFGLNGRDWQNIMTGRFISPLRELAHQAAPYHLRQRFSPPNRAAERP